SERDAASDVKIPKKRPACKAGLCCELRRLEREIRLQAHGSSTCAGVVRVSEIRRHCVRWILNIEHVHIESRRFVGVVQRVEHVCANLECALLAEAGHAEVTRNARVPGHDTRLTIAVALHVSDAWLDQPANLRCICWQTAEHVIERAGHKRCAEKRSIDSSSACRCIGITKIRTPVKGVAVTVGIDSANEWCIR